MSQALPTKCPVCGGEMTPRVFGCSECGAEIKGEFQPGRFSKLSSTQTRFLETFIYCLGSLKDLGAILGISYPTVRARLDDLIAALELTTPPISGNIRLEVLNKLKNGEITTADALAELSALN